MSANTSFCIPRMDTRSIPGSIEEIKTFIVIKFKAVIRLTENDIDIIAKYTDQGYMYYTAFIHPKHPSDIIYDGFIKDINDTGKTKVYFDKWFWLVRKSTAPRPSSVAAIPVAEMGFAPEEEDELFAEMALDARANEWLMLHDEYLNAGPTLEQLLDQEDRKVCAHLREIM
jgi:hypothetical protein